MNDVGGLSKSEMLAAAKRKLKDFENKRNVDSRNSPTSSVVSSEPYGGAGMNGRSSCISDDSNRVNDLLPPQEPQQIARNGSSPFQHNGNEWYQAYTQLKSQHDELCNHYSQLHSAYSQVNANGVHVDTENQIIQLQNALSTMVEEKLACQTELRKAKEAIDQMKEEMKKPKEVPQAKPNDVDSAEVKNLMSKIAEKDSLLFARHAEIENARREVATMQANLLTVQHERSEAQARVKSLIRDNSNLESNVQSLRKEIQMKDLHLKQFGAHNMSAPSGHVDISNEQVENFKAEIEALKNERTRLLGEAATLKSHYLEREQSLTQRQQEMAAELESLHSHRFSSEDKVQHLENQLHFSNSEIEKLRAGIVVPEVSHEIATSQLSEEDVNKRVKEAINCERGIWEKRLEEEQRKREELNMDKDRVIFESQQSLAELEMRYRLLEERTLESTANGADLLSLSEQLQNEKSTVSRAVAQNKELKAQIIDVEDRLIAVTEEKLKIELARQSAEHQVKELTKQLNLETAGLVSNINISDVIATQPHLERAIETEEYEEQQKEDAMIQEKMQNLEQENLEIREQLSQAVGELSQVRAELRRSNTQNERMDEIMRQNAEDENQNSIHVELTQAVGRVQELATENDSLREVVRNVEVQLEEERNRSMGLEQRLGEVIHQQRQASSLVEKDEPLTFVPTNISAKQPESKDTTKDEEKEAEKEWARRELEKRFAKAMMDNADLVENMDRLEHINQQLQLENDTIADHVILYQHQRTVVRERLRKKDEQLKTMEEERQRVVQRCQELQNVLMTVLNKGGVLKEYETTSAAKRAARKVSRSYSHSTVDEMSGDEDVVIDAKYEEVPTREQSTASPNPVLVHGASSPEVPSSPNGLVSPARSFTPITENKIEQDASVKRILEIISDISKPPTVPSGLMHCTQCIGKLEEL